MNVLSASARAMGRSPISWTGKGAFFFFFEGPALVGGGVGLLEDAGEGLAMDAVESAVVGGGVSVIMVVGVKSDGSSATGLSSRSVSSPASGASDCALVKGMITSWLSSNKLMVHTDRV